MMHKNNGFTLIEVLIAMLILAVGLLGLAALQTHSLKNNQSAYYRSQATQLAYDIADRMRVNVASAATYTNGHAAEHKNCLTTDSCTPLEMAEHDLFEWNTAIQAAILPSATGKIKPDLKITGGVKAYIVTIEWDENRDLATDKKTSFDMGFRL
jgi:type IV pilus assembly protein PilV